MRPWLAVLFAVSGCATFPDAHLETLRARLAVQRADTSCGPVAFRRAALGARWGEYLKVTVNAPGPVSGEARLYVDRRPGPPVRFDTSPWTLSPPTPEGAPEQAWPSWSVQPETPLLASAQQAVVVDVAWPNEQLDVDSALPKGAPLELSVGGLASATGSCDGVTFTVEQGVLQPTIDERAWVAELERRGGPAWRARVEAEARRADEIRRAQWAAVDARHAAERATWAERTAVADEIRQRHYAEWAQRREARFAVEASVQVAVDEVELDSGAQQNVAVALDAGGQQQNLAAVGWTADAACSSETCGVLRASGDVASAWSGSWSADAACSSATCGVQRSSGAQTWGWSGVGGSCSGGAANVGLASVNATPVVAGAGVAFGGGLWSTGSSDVSWTVPSGGAEVADGWTTDVSGEEPAADTEVTIGADGWATDVSPEQPSCGAWTASVAGSSDVLGQQPSCGAPVVAGTWTTNTACSGDSCGVRPAAAPSSCQDSANGAWLATDTQTSSWSGQWAGDTAGSGAAGGVLLSSDDVTVDSDVSVDVDTSWLAAWPTVDVTAEADGWVLPAALQRVEVSRTTETLQPPPMVAASVTVDASAAAAVAVVDPFVSFLSAVVTGLVQAAPPPPAPVHRAVPAKR